MFGVLGRHNQPGKEHLLESVRNSAQFRSRAQGVAESAGDGREGMTTVYLVSSGSYSDYHIHGIYSTRKLAKQRAAIVRDANAIETFELDQGIDLIAQGLLPWGVWFFEQKEPSTYQSEMYFDSAIAGEIVDDRRRPFRGNWNAEFSVFVFARDEAHALKIAQDKRAEYLAKEAGV